MSSIEAAVQIIKGQAWRVSAGKRVFGLRASRLTQEKVLRIIADALLVNFALLCSLTLRFLYLIAFEVEKNANYTQVLWTYVRAYRGNAWILTLLCVTIFYLSGFYTYGRVYHGRYKAFVVAQAVGLSHLVFGFLSYFTGQAFRLPRGVLILVWLLSTTLLITSRLWSLLWRRVMRTESSIFEKSKKEKVEKVLVIGGAGYIGSALLHKLLNKGYRVRLLDIFLYGTDPIKDVLRHPSLELVHADFRHVDRVVAAMDGVDAVIHLGGIVGYPACALDDELTIEINLMATSLIAEV